MPCAGHRRDRQDAGARKRRTRRARSLIWPVTSAIRSALDEIGLGQRNDALADAEQIEDREMLDASAA